MKLRFACVLAGLVSFGVHSIAPSQTVTKLAPIQPVLVTPEDMDYAARLADVIGVPKIGNKRSYRYQHPPVKLSESEPVSTLYEPPAGMDVGNPRRTFTQDNVFTGLGDNGAGIPPDTMGGVGTSTVVVMINTQAREGTKPAPGGSPTWSATKTLNAWWTLSDSFDPHVMFDPGSNRWFSCVATWNGITLSNSMLHVGCSTTAGDAETFTRYTVDPDADNNEWADYPLIGFNNTWMAMTANMFDGSFNFTETRMWVFDKSQLVAGAATTPTLIAPIQASGNDIFTCVPAYTYGAETSLWTVSSGWTSGPNKALQIGRITGTASTPSWAHVGFLATPTVAYSFSVPDMQQSGANDNVDGGDFRTQKATFYNGKLYLTHGAGLPAASPDRAAFAWYELTPSPLALNRGGVVDPGSATEDNAYGSVAPAQTGEAAPPLIGGATSTSDASFLSAGAWGVDFNSSAVTLPKSNVFSAGTANYFKDFGSGTNRWGDYSQSMVDPSEPTRVWTIQERCSSTNVWQVVFAAYRWVPGADVKGWESY